MKILGLDPGLARTGYGIIEISKNSPELVNYGCIVTGAGENHGNRLQIIYREVRKIISKFKPDVVALEKLFFAKNVKTALKVGEARGITTLAVISKGLKIKEFTPLEVKLSVVGRGRASKPQVQYMITQLIGNLKEIPKSDDAADALAIALCYFHSFPRNKIKND